MVGVEQQQEGVIGDLLAAGVTVGDRLAVVEQADGAGEPGIPVVVAHLGAVGLAPAELGGAANGTAAEVAPPPQHGVVAAQRDEAASEVDQILVNVLPVVPGDLVVLAVGVVVAALGAAGLVAAEQHRGPLGQQQGGQEVALLAPP